MLPCDPVEQCATCSDQSGSSIQAKTRESANPLRHCNVCAVTAAQVERTGGGALEARQIALSASSVDDIFNSIRLVARALGVEEHGEALVLREQARLQAIRKKTAGPSRKSVAVVEWTDPVFVMANWGPELVDVANGDPVLGRKGEYSTAIDGQRLLEINPEFLIVAPCGFNMERSLAEQSRLEQYPWWAQLQAVRTGKVAFADGNLFFNRSGMTIAQTAEIVAEILHGISFGHAHGAHWRMMSAPVLIESPL